jgi:hypothetical protein
MIQTPDFSSLPAFSWDRTNIGAKLTGLACWPTSKQQAAYRANALHRMGYRAIGLHHLDVPVLERGYSLDNVKWLLDYCGRKGIAGFTSCRSELPWSDTLAKQIATLPNIVALSPSNEDVDDHFAERSKMIRSWGYAGKLFRSNALIQGGEFGDLADAHIYSGHPLVKQDGSLEYFMAHVYHPDSGWNNRFTPPQNIDLIVTECGASYPNPFRLESDIAYYDHMLALDADSDIPVKVRLIMPYAFATGEADWYAGKAGTGIWNYANDPERVDAVNWLAARLQGWEYIPRTGNPAFRAVKVESPLEGYAGAPMYRIA